MCDTLCFVIARNKHQDPDLKTLNKKPLENRDLKNALSLSGLSPATPNDLEVCPALRDLHVIEPLCLGLQLLGPCGRRRLLDGSQEHSAMYFQVLVSEFHV